MTYCGDAALGADPEWPGTGGDYGYVPIVPVKPKKRIVVIIGFLLGFVAAVGFVFIREYTIVEINSIEKLRKKGYPLLAVIPDMKEYIKDNFDGRETVRVKGHTVDTGLVMVLDSISPISESFRRLQANVIYSQPDNTFKTLIITSSNKSEGKTTLSTNLAEPGGNHPFPQAARPHPGDAGAVRSCVDRFRALRHHLRCRTADQIGGWGDPRRPLQQDQGAGTRPHHRKPAESESQRARRGDDGLRS